MKRRVIFEVLLVIFLFLFSMYMWSLPIKNNPLPYGEVDSAHHFGIADYMSDNDKIEDFYKPTFLYFGYSHRSAAGEGRIGTESPYTPNFFINEAIAQIIGGDRFVSYFLFLTISCVSIVFSSYFLIRKLFGIVPAFLACLLIIVSKIDIMTFMMGQYVILVSFACLPLILYCYYKYTNSFLRKKPRQIYLYVMAFFIATQFFNHYWSLADTFVILLVFTIFLIVKERRLPFSIKHAALSLVILLAVTGPFIGKAVASIEAEPPSTADTTDISNDWGDLFKWYTGGYSKIAVDQSMFSYKQMHGYWTLPFLLIGGLFLLLRRKRKDLLLLAWLCAIYLILHFDLFLGWGASRLLRSVNDVPYIFYILAGIGFVYLPNLIKLRHKCKRYVTYALIIIFILLFFNFNLKSSFDILDNAYPSPYRMNLYQYEAALWMEDNIPEDSFIFDKGTLVQKTIRFIRSVSHRYITESAKELEWQRSVHQNETIELTHNFVDYSELAMLGMKKEIDALQQWENSNLGNLTPIYDKDYIRIYDVRGK